MENPKSYREIENEKMSDSLREGVKTVVLTEGMKSLKRAHHELVSSLPELENNLKHVEAFVLVLTNMREMLIPETFLALSVIINDVIIDQIRRFEDITRNINKTTKEYDAGIQSEQNE